MSYLNLNPNDAAGLMLVMLGLMLAIAVFVWWNARRSDRALDRAEELRAAAALSADYANVSSDAAAGSAKAACKFAADAKGHADRATLAADAACVAAGAAHENERTAVGHALEAKEYHHAAARAEANAAGSAKQAACEADRGGRYRSECRAARDAATAGDPMNGG